MLIVIIIDNNNIINNDINQGTDNLGTSKADLIMHPARFMILQSLAGQQLTTQEISEAIPSVPKSSLYRHLKILLDGGMVEVAETRPVKGIHEMVYRLVKAPYLGPEDMSGVTKDEHLRYFASYLATLLQGFADYLDTSERLNLLADRVGYTEAKFYADTEELDQFSKDLNQSLLTLLKNKPGKNRHKHKIAFVTYPVSHEEIHNE
jgi:DNA-binding transcriptional ArsR family regulator